MDYELYRVNVKAVQSWIDEKKRQNLTQDQLEKTMIRDCSKISAATHCPVLCVMHYVGEIIGFYPELLYSMERIKKFYNLRQ